MLGYNEGQVLELFKNTWTTGYYYLLFDIQNYRERVDSAKHIMTKLKLDKYKSKLNPMHPLKMHSSEKPKSVKFDEYKFLDNQIDRLAEVIHKINTRSLGRQNQQDTPYRLYIIPIMT